MFFFSVKVNKKNIYHQFSPDDLNKRVMKFDKHVKQNT